MFSPSRIVFVVCFSMLAFTTQTAAQVTVDPGTLTYSQNFDTLAVPSPNTPGTITTNITWSNNATLPGWSLFRPPAPGVAITTYGAGDGSNNTGNFYGLGTGGTTERAFGGIASGNAYFGSPAGGAVAGWIAVGFTNNTGQPIESANLAFDGEQWRNGGNPLAQTMVLEFGFGSTFETVATWTAPGGNFNWASVVNSATAAAVDGNGAGLVAGRGGVLSGLDGNFTDGSTLWVRWIEDNNVGNDHGLAIDNFAVTFTPIPEPASVLTACGLVVAAAVGIRRSRQNRTTVVGRPLS